jgi:hypothetical protein
VPKFPTLEQIPRRKVKGAQTDKVQCYEPATMKYLGYFPVLTPDEVIILLCYPLAFFSQLIEEQMNLAMY